ncbi:hypothetical protein BC833DRAFT_609098 [Globomyces pollinis-pini]|nr:hypothetical protein BC833DRAFT_609098 [Globomyces pollinis-pini]
MQFSSLLLSLSSVLAATVPISGAPPNPNQVYIKEITYGGTGCPANTVAIAMSEDRTTFTLIFDQFVASSGPGTTVTDFRKNCQVNVDLRYPSGFSYSIAQVDYRGYVNVPAGLTATQKSNYYFSGQQNQISAQSVFTGPYTKDYLVSDKIEIAKYVWSPCGSVARGNVNAQVRLEGNTSLAGQITVDSIDGKVKQTFGIIWKTC